MDAERLRGPHRQPARPERGACGSRGLHARDPPRRDRRRHRELPQASPTRCSRSTTGSTTPCSAPPSTRAWIGSSTSPRRWCSSAPPSSRPTEAHLLDCLAPRSAYGFSKLAGEVYCRALHDEHRLPYTICRPFNAYGPGELPDDEPGIAHMVPDVIRKVLAGARPLPIFGSGEQTRTLTHLDDIADGIVTAMASPAGETRTSMCPRRRSSAIAEIARLIWEACGEDPADFELEHLPSFEVDVQRAAVRRKARRLLGWEARVDLREGWPARSSGCASASPPLAAGERLRHRRRGLRRSPPAHAAGRRPLGSRPRRARPARCGCGTRHGSRRPSRSDLPPRCPGLGRALLAGASGRCSLRTWR